ncbi:MAG: 3-phosphoshikimate 1-carboxyvinyltransferase [Lachnospiraceae bacterium]|nr:3-phosphoshikimate 1-carboxyvinyltransferase [Lachnospiraceae bacterium]
MIITPAKGPLKGEIQVPGDKSITHRAVMFGSIARGTTEIRGFLKSADCLSTIGCFRSMGISIEINGDIAHVEGKGLHGLKKPEGILDCGNSGTTMRLMSGILTGQDFESRLTGDSSIQKRPMNRIIQPLTELNARISSIKGNGCAPLFIQPSRLHGGTINSRLSSAQVKSAVLLSGLYADGEVCYREPFLSRNHSELMLSSFGALVTGGTEENPECRVSPGGQMEGQLIHVPGDISSAAYFLGAALLVPGSEILIQNTGINPTRDGILKVFKSMGADISLLNEKESGGEKTADILVRYSPLRSLEIGNPIIPALIDEIPLIAVVASQAEGTTVIRDAGELRVKESDRITITAENLRRLGVKVDEMPDGMIIHGPSPLHGAVIDTAGDHRIAMSMSIAGLALPPNEEVEIKDADCVSISYPEFYQALSQLKANS